MNALPPLLERGKVSQLLTVIVPAAAGGVDGIRPIKATGRFLYIVDSPDGIQMRLDGQPFVDGRPGTGLECEDGAWFEWFELRNPTASEITVKVYVGFARYIDQRVSVIEGPTEAVGWAVASVGANAGVSFPGTPTGTRIRRKDFVVSNLDTSLSLQVRDSAAAVALTVFPRQNITLPISGAVELYNPNGSAVQANVCEVFWVRQ
jgi:hypothetical protein